jgi:hypothetical protein
MMSWLGYVWPLRIISVAAFWYVAVELIIRFCESQGGGPMTEMAATRDMVLLLGVPVYGAFRVCAFYPIYRPQYFQWLLTSAWDGRKPLPLGPVYLVLQDVALVGACCLLILRNPNCDWEHLCLSFFTAYLLLLMVTFLFERLKWDAYAQLYGLGVVVYLWHKPFHALGASVVLYAVAFLGLKRALARLPWKTVEFKPAAETLLTRQIEIGGGTLGWPFDRLRPQKRTGPAISAVDGMLVGLLIGWWTYVCASLVPEQSARNETLTVIYCIMVAMVPLIRLAVYAAGCGPPISLLGRVVTMRWIIPGYDKVFVAPLLTALVGIFSLWVLAWINLPRLYAVPISISLVWSLAFDLGPTLESWRLTGAHRIVPGRFNRTVFVEV